MTTIDFTRIRSTPKSRNDSFEALSVQLFRESYDAPRDATFVSLRGDGGDGGVEAYVRLASGDVIGVQAKYLWQLRAAELSQIDGSLDTALKNHPALCEYWVYIPFDLTGRVAAGVRGKSQAERFEAWKQKVEAAARARGRDLKIRLCSAAVARAQILECDTSGGLRSYWFDDAVLTQGHVRECLDDAAAFAGPRFTSGFDVVTNAHAGLDFFGGIGDFEAWRRQALQPPLAELRRLGGWGNEALDILGGAEAAEVRNLVEQTIGACEAMTDVPSLAMEAARARLSLNRALSLLAKVRDAQEQAFDRDHGVEHDTPAYRQFHADHLCSFPAGNMDAARQWVQQAQALQEALSSPEMGAATNSSMMLLGPAGIGKTQSIVNAAYRRIKRGGYSLVVFGDDFGRGEPWEVMRSKLGFGASVSRPALLASLQSCAVHTGLPFIIYIDALNESPRNARWKSKLPELLSQCAPYPDIKVCVSTRDTFKDLVVDARFPGYAFEHRGFAGKEFEAVQAFASHYKLDAEITPMFSPELGNPLFLHLACRTLQAEGRQSLDVSLQGFTALLDQHLVHCDGLVRGRLAYSNPRNVVRAAMLRLADLLTHNTPHDRTWDVCSAELKSLVGEDVTAEALLKELEHEGLVILSAGPNDTWHVRLGYQRYGDVLRASSLVEGLSNAGKLNVALLARKLASLGPEDEGLLLALAAVLPERCGVEITESALGLDPALSHSLFIRALVSRSRDSITDEIHDAVFGALATPALWPEVYDAFFRVCLIPGHRLNAVNWLSRFLRRAKIVGADRKLSHF